MREGLLKRASFITLDRSGMIAISGMLVKGVGILVYHGVTATPGTPQGNRRRLHVAQDRFEQHLDLISRRWHPVSLSAFCEARLAQRALPPRSVVVTIDDGYRNVLTTALPLLKRFGVPATVFVLTGELRAARMWVDRLEAAIEATAASSLRWDGREFPLTSVTAKTTAARRLASVLEAAGDKRAAVLNEIVASLGVPEGAPDPDRDLLTWDEIRVLRDEGLEIGSHADVHEPLTRRPLPDVRHRLAQSRKTLEAQLGPGRYALAYPYGAWNSSIAVAAREAGFYCAVTTDPGLNTDRADLFELKRLLIGADDDVIRLRASLTGLRSFWRSNTPCG
jgi:peptidoglycan/xylan/chitin deacetylase (PgdA/CDA1 family)